MKPSVILLIAVLVAATVAGLCVSFDVFDYKESKWQFENPNNKDFFKLHIERILESLRNGTKEQQRYQLMGWTITGLIALVGFALTKEESEHRGKLFMLALSFCVFMHCLDTMLFDLMNRQGTYGQILNTYLLKWDSLTDADMQKVLKKINEGNEPNDGYEGQYGWVRKIRLFLWPGLFAGLWWWGLVGIVFFLIGCEWHTKWKGGAEKGTGYHIYWPYARNP